MQGESPTNPKPPFEQVEPWPTPVDGAALAEEIAGLFRDHLVLPAGGADAATLWVFVSHVSDVADVSPNLGIISPQKRCGKTTFLGLLTALVRDPLPASNATPASIFRAIEAWQPTLLIDEAETFVSNVNNELRGILNSGHTRQTAFVLRCAPETFEPQSFSTWCPKVFALIGRLPATLEDRSIIIPMRRRIEGEKVERLDLRRLAPRLREVRRKLVRWADDNKVTLAALTPERIDGLGDRAQDSWEPLAAIAANLGGRWLERARAAATTLAALMPKESGDYEIALLEDLRTIFRARNLERVPSALICDDLAQMEHRPWPEWKNGKPITAVQLSAALAPFGVRPKVIRWGAGTQRGYELAAFADAFARYLPPEAETDETSETGED